MIRKSSFSAHGTTDFSFRIAPNLAQIQAKCQLLQLMKGQHIVSNNFYEMLISDFPGGAVVKNPPATQWFRICLPMQGTQVRALVQEDPTCHRAAKPVRHNY